MKQIIVSPLPDMALLTRYRDAKAYTDCYSLEVPHTVALAHYIEAFYTTPLFKIERFILAALVRKPSNDTLVHQLANGESAKFAAWSVEARTEDQILLCDFMKRTRSWLMCVATSPSTTRLYFGSSIAPERISVSGQVSLGVGFRLLLGFHQLYSRALLRSAAQRLRNFQAN